MRKENTEDYQKFIESFKNEVCRITEDWNANIKFQPVQGDQSEDYLAVETDGRNGKHVQRFHLWEIYQDFESGEFSMEEVFSEVAKMLDCCKEVERISPLDKILDYQEICSHLVVRPLNYDDNMERLKGGVYERVGDIALALYVHIGRIKERYISSMVPSDAFLEWDLEKEDVMAAAAKNTYDLFPPRMIYLAHLEDLIQGNTYAFMDGEELPFNLDRGYGVFVTNASQMNGAISIFLPGVAKKLGELLGGDYYIAFTSLHEVVLHKIGTVELEQIRKSLNGMNMEVIAEEDFLSEKVYRYSWEKDRIEVIEC